MMTLSYQESVVLKTTAAKQAIMELDARYGRTLEQGDAEGWVGCFVVEGILEGQSQDPVMGHPALVRHFREMRHDVLHLTTDCEIEVNGVKATQTSRFLLIEPGSGGPSVVQAGTYHDDLIFERGRWYLFRRKVGG